MARRHRSRDDLRLADLDRFWRALFAGELVDAATLSEMLDANEQGHGLGVISVPQPPVQDVTLYGNGGNVVGYTTHTYYEPSTQTMIMLMTPTGRGITPRLLDDVVRWALD